MPTNDLIRAGDVLAALRRVTVMAPNEPEDGDPLPDDRQIAALRQHLDAAGAPATKEEILRGLTALFASFKIGSGVENPKAYMAAMATEIAEFPAQVIEASVRRARRELKWLPAIAEMVEICEALVSPLRHQQRALSRIEAEARRRREAARQAAEREARETAWIAERLDALRQQFGEAAPTKIQIDRVTHRWPEGAAIRWSSALFGMWRGENWAVEAFKRLGEPEDAPPAERAREIVESALSMRAEPDAFAE